MTTKPLAEQGTFTGLIAEWRRQKTHGVRIMGDVALTTFDARKSCADEAQQILDRLRSLSEKMECLHAYYERIGDGTGPQESRLVEPADCDCWTHQLRAILDPKG